MKFVAKGRLRGWFKTANVEIDTGNKGVSMAEKDIWQHIAVSFSATTMQLYESGEKIEKILEFCYFFSFVFRQVH